MSELLLTWLFSMRIGAMSKPSIVTLGISAPARAAIVGKRSSVAASCCNELVYEVTMYSTSTNLVRSPWRYLPWPASNTWHSLPSLPSCAFTTAQEPSIATSYFSCKGRSTYYTTLIGHKCIYMHSCGITHCQL